MKQVSGINFQFSCHLIIELSSFFTINVTGEEHELCFPTANKQNGASTPNRVIAGAAAPRHLSMYKYVLCVFGNAQFPAALRLCRSLLTFSTFPVCIFHLLRSILLY